MELVYYCIVCRSVPNSYADQLVEEGVMEREEVTKITADHMSFLAEQFKLVDSTVPKVPISRAYPCLVIHTRYIVKNSPVRNYLDIFNLTFNYPKMEFILHSIPQYYYEHSIVLNEWLYPSLKNYFEQN